MEYKTDIESKRLKEKNVVKLMIGLYCKGHKHSRDGLCDEGEELLEYSYKPVDLCPFIEVKTFWQHCKIHCYNQEMRKKIKEVMRYSGTRMLLYHPIMAIRHDIESYKERRDIIFTALVVFVGIMIRTICNILSSKTFYFSSV